MNSWQVIIGLEVHIELATRSKMFCSCSADYFGRPPNTHACPVCLGLPGALPVANQKACEWTVLAGLAFDCQIPKLAKFDRKNYFYPDLPKGYQISQYDMPFARGGELKFKVPRQMAGRQSEKFKVRIRRVHLEEDTGKLIHTKNTTLIDFNRSGVPLMELVTEPDIHSARAAKEFLKKLQQIIRYLEISDCDMEKGSLRIEPNVSVRRKPKSTSDGGRVKSRPWVADETSDSSEVGGRAREQERLPSYKVEIKNINSFRFAERAIDFEIKRQIKLLEKGKKPLQETRGWDEARQATYSQRLKEQAQDYRYFPEPDLTPIRWGSYQLSVISNQLPELPDQKAVRFQKEYGLDLEQVHILISTKEKADYFEEAVRAGRKHNLSAKKLAKVIVNKKVDAEKLLPAQLIQALAKKERQPQLSPEGLNKIVTEVIKGNSRAVEDYRKGKENAIMFLIGQVMKKTKGLADANQVKQIILSAINNQQSTT